MAVSVTVRGGGGGDIVASFQRSLQDVVRFCDFSAEQAMIRAGDEMKKRGDADISGGGNFGARWTDAFEVTVETQGMRSTIRATMGVPYWKIFQYGGTIAGKPLLWIPLSGTDAVGKSAREYGPLFRTQRKDGLLLLGSVDTGEMKYFGKASVTQKKRFHLIEVCEDAGEKIVPYFSELIGRFSAA